MSTVMLKEKGRIGTVSNLPLWVAILSPKILRCDRDSELEDVPAVTEIHWPWGLKWWGEQAREVSRDPTSDS